MSHLLSKFPRIHATSASQAHAKSVLWVAMKTELKTFADVHKVLEGFISPPHHTRVYTLDTMRTLMHALGDPQNKVRVVHVAGTSGKTSTAYYIAALLRAAGEKVGLTVSPHVDEVNERVQIDLVPLPEAVFCSELSEFLRLIATVPVHPSYFELLVAFAYWEFVRQGVSYAVVEVGVGGLLDGTNVINRADKVCVITDIGLDHVQILGSTLGEIAAQKAGIIQKENHIWMYRQSDEVMTPIHARCTEKQAQLHELAPTDMASTFSFLPLFQQRNFGLAQAVVAFIRTRDGAQPLDDAALQQAAQVAIPARMEVRTVGNKTVILDGAHNPQKLHTLVTSIAERYPQQPIATLASFVQGRGYSLDENVQELAHISSVIIGTSFHTAQDARHDSTDPATITAACARAGMPAKMITDPVRAFQALLDRPEPIVLVTGSFYLLNFIRPLLSAT